MGITQMIQELESQACGGRSEELSTLRCSRRTRETCPAWEETWSLQMFSEEILKGSRQFLLPEFILGVLPQKHSRASWFGGEDSATSTSWEGISPGKISHWHLLSVLSGLHITAELFYFATEKDCQKRVPHCHTQTFIIWPSIDC